MDSAKTQSWVYVTVTIVTCILLVGIAWGSLIGDVEANTEHRTDTDVHMRYQQKIKEFVPRGEYNDTKEDIKEMKEKIDKIYDVLIGKGK